MSIKPALKSGTYLSSGAGIILEFNQPILQDKFIDCSNVFDDNTNRWLPESKSCYWITPEKLRVEYNPNRGSMEELTIKANSFYYNYKYSQQAADQTTVKLAMPAMDATIKISSLNGVSVCDTLQFFGVIVSPTIYPLNFKWQITYDPPLPDYLESDAKSYFAPYAEYTKNSALPVPSRFLKAGTKITATISAMHEKFSNLVISASKTVTVYASIPKVKFTSKSAYILELDGSRSNRIPLLIDNVNCNSELMHVDTKFTVMSGQLANSTSNRGELEINIESKINEEYENIKTVLVSQEYGFKYLTYYNLSVVVTILESGIQNSDSIILFFVKPPLQSIIESPGTLISIRENIVLKGEKSQFPALEADTKSFLWKCINATPLSTGGRCQCPILSPSETSAANLILMKQKLVALCKFKFYLSVRATKGDYVRSSYATTEFMTIDQPTFPLQGKVVKGMNNAVNDLYFTYGREENVSESGSSYNWTLTEVESTDPNVQEKYSEKNAFIYSFFKDQMSVNIDPEILKEDVTIPAGNRRRLKDVAPSYLTSQKTRVLGVDKSDMMSNYKYTYAVTIKSDAGPSFLFITLNMPAAPRPRSFKITPTSGEAYKTTFVFTFTLEASNEADGAKYQLFRRNCQGSSEALSPISAVLTQSNSYSATVGPGLKNCKDEVEIVLRVYEYDSSIDIKSSIIVTQPPDPLEQVLRMRVEEMDLNKGLTIDQKITILSEIANAKVPEESENSKRTVNMTVNELQKIDVRKGMLNNMDQKDKVALLETVSTTMSNLITHQSSNFDLSHANSISQQVDSYISEASKDEEGTKLLPSVLTTLSGVTAIGQAKKSDQSLYVNVQNTTNKMAEMKLNNVLPGAVPYSIGSEAINMRIEKNFIDDYNKSKNFTTAKGASFDMPAGIADLMKRNVNQTVKGNLVIGSSVKTTTYNPYSNIKANTNITISSLTAGSTQGFKEDTVAAIYSDIGAGKLDEYVDKEEQSADLFEVEFKSYEMNSDASQKNLDTSPIAGELPAGQEAAYSLPFGGNMSDIVGQTIVVPLFYNPTKKLWSNTNCSLDSPNIGDKAFRLRCNHLGLADIRSVNQAFVVTLDIIKDVLNVIKAGNYEQLVQFSALIEFSYRTLIIYPLDALVIILVIYASVYLAERDRKILYTMRLECLCRKFNPIDERIEGGRIHKVLHFLSKVRKKGMKQLSKENNNQQVTPYQPEAPINRLGTQSGETLIAKRQEKKKERKIPNGFTVLSKQDVVALRDTYEMYRQLIYVYDEDEIDEIMEPILADHAILNRITQNYIMDLVVTEPSSFCTLMKYEHPIFNSLLLPEITSPRHMKVLIVVSVFLGELFVTGYFQNSQPTATEEEESPDGFLSKAVIYSIAANLLMVPVKIIIAIFMTGASITAEMTREDIESLERKAPTFRMIGQIFGFAFILFFVYGITMYVLTFTEYALDGWMASFGVSMFSEVFLVAQAKLMLKIIIGVFLMRISRSRLMLSVAGAIANKIVDWIMALF